MKSWYGMHCSYHRNQRMFPLQNIDEHYRFLVKGRQRCLRVGILERLQILEAKEAKYESSYIRDIFI